MRRNHVHDKDQLDKIERRLAEGTPTGFEVIDDLADTVPRADPRFMDELEARLMIRMQSRERVAEEKKDEKPMITTTALPKRQLRPVFKPSLTLIAAILAAVLVGAALLMVNNGGSQPETEFGAGLPAQESTATATIIPTLPDTPPPTSVPDEPPMPVTTDTMTYVPTPFPTPTIIPGNDSNQGEIMVSPTMVPTGIPAEAVIAIPPSTLRLVVIAAHDLPQGAEINQSDVILTYWPADSVPDGAFDGLVNLVLRHTTRDIAQWQPIMFGDVQ